jgi:hypothetical protein
LQSAPDLPVSGASGKGEEPSSAGAEDLSFMDEERLSAVQLDRPTAPAEAAAVGAVAPAARAAQRELERARRAEAARIAALVRYMLHDHGEPASASTKPAPR